jgi:hypothetical protein
LRDKFLASRPSMLLNGISNLVVNYKSDKEHTNLFDLVGNRKVCKLVKFYRLAGSSFLKRFFGIGLLKEIFSCKRCRDFIGGGQTAILRED